RVRALNRPCPTGAIRFRTAAPRARCPLRPARAPARTGMTRTALLSRPHRARPLAPPVAAQATARATARWTDDEPDVAWASRSSHVDLALFRSVPVMHAARVHLDHHQAWRIHALLEPALQVLVPVFQEQLPVADQCGCAFHIDMDARGAEHVPATLEGERDFRILLDVAHDLRVVPREVVGIALIIDFA